MKTLLLAMLCLMIFYGCKKSSNYPPVLSTWSLFKIVDTGKSSKGVVTSIIITTATADTNISMPGTINQQITTKSFAPTGFNTSFFNITSDTTGFLADPLAISPVIYSFKTGYLKVMNPNPAPSLAALNGNTPSYIKLINDSTISMLYGEGGGLISLGLYRKNK